jgi:hypothetical protein
MKKGLVLFFGFLCIAMQLNAQDSTAMKSYDKISLGIGGGLDYGGIGANFLVYPTKSIGLFAGGGYALAGFGYNAGIKVRFVSKKPTAKWTPYLTGMYGYNAAVAVSGDLDFNKLYYGPTFGFGFDFKSSPNKKGYWSFALLVPIRDPAANDKIEDLEDQGAEFMTKLFPIGVSIGYRFIFK